MSSSSQFSFVDEAYVRIVAGSGGHGCLSFRREKYIEFGGPDGGNGGKGGDIIVCATSNINTLIEFRYKKIVKASSGACGAGKRRNGAYGKDEYIHVPLGTNVEIRKDNGLFKGGSPLYSFDLDVDGMSKVIACGGKGGVGNHCFKNSTDRSPRKFTEGELGDSFVIRLSLKVIGDVGLVGLPNSGKSTFISRCSASKSKVGNYCFTTLHPHLGVVNLKHKSFVMVDIPGLISGASEGVGLGHKFLKHVEKCRFLLHLIDVTSKDILHDYKIIRDEMYKYNSVLCQKDFAILLTKCDLIDDKLLSQKTVDIINYTCKDVYHAYGFGARCQDNDRMIVCEISKRIIRLSIESPFDPMES